MKKIILALMVLALIVTLAVAQRPGRHSKQNAEGLETLYEVPKNQPDLSGKFSLARLRFDLGGMYGGYGMHLGDGGFPWSHDFPGAARHLMKIIKELSKVNVVLDTNEVIYSFAEPDLYKYPMVYLCEVGYMTLSDREIAGWREYCLRGGFVLIDDFRGERDMYNLRSYLKRAFPEYEMKELQLAHPVFNCFFSIKTLDVRPIYGGGYVSYETLKPKFYGLEDDQGRLMMVINYNYDISDYWQFSDDPFAPIEETNEAYKFGVNYVMYALTH